MMPLFRKPFEKPTFELARVTTCPGDRAVLWRYMDFPSFLSLLVDRKIFFCPSDRLGDPLEGSLTGMQQMHRWYESGSNSLEALDLSNTLMEKARERFFVSCWHFSKHESNAMWQLYSRLHKGVAIRTTLGRLKESITNFDRTVFVGSVDYSERAMNHSSMLCRLFLKRKAFAYEKEFRAIVVGTREDGAGIQATADLDTLILSLHLSPFCEQWLFELIQKVVKRYGYRFSVGGGSEKVVF